jgi:hypothetical protein
MRFGVHAVTILIDASAFIDGRCFDGSVSVGCVFSSLRTRAGKIEAIALADATAPLVECRRAMSYKTAFK